MNILEAGVAARNHTLSVRKSKARLQGRDWTITDDEAFALFAGNCHWCGLQPSNRTRGVGLNGGVTYSGIDRLNNDLGYAPGNVVSCCRQCNTVKRATPLPVWIEWLDRVTTHRIELRN